MCVCVSACVHKIHPCTFVHFSIFLSQDFSLSQFLFSFLFPAFLLFSGLSTCAYRLDAEYNRMHCSEREKDVVRLRMYTAVVYAPQALLPYLGWYMLEVAEELLQAVAISVCALFMIHV